MIVAVAILHTMTRKDLVWEERDKMPDVTKGPVPASITTPSRVEAGIGNLEVANAYPTRETAEKVCGHLDYLHAARRS